MQKNGAEFLRKSARPGSPTPPYTSTSEGRLTTLHAMQSRLGSVTAAVTAVAIVGTYEWNELRQPGIPAGLASSNDRIEATAIDSTTKSAPPVVMHHCLFCQSYVRFLST